MLVIITVVITLLYFLSDSRQYVISYPLTIRTSPKCQIARMVRNNVNNNPNSSNKQNPLTKQTKPNSVNRKAQPSTSPVQLMKPPSQPKKVESEESLDELERQVKSKYGSKAFQYDMNDEDDDDDRNNDEVAEQIVEPKIKGSLYKPGAFNGFQPRLDTSVVTISMPLKSDEPIDRSIENKRNAITTSSSISLLSRLRNQRSKSSNADQPRSSTIEDFMSEMDYEGINEVENEIENENESNLKYFMKPDSLKKSKSSAPTVHYRLRRPPNVDNLPLQQSGLNGSNGDRRVDSRDVNSKGKNSTSSIVQPPIKVKEKDRNDFTAFQFRTSEELNNEATSDRTTDELFTTGSFESIGVNHPIVLQNLKRMNMIVPTKVQAAALPLLQSGVDIIMQAQTGSGKTVGFLLPLIDVVDPTKRKVQAIIMAPSRELVTQIGQVASNLFKGTDYKVLSIIGGANVNNQIRILKEERPQIIVATPGRLGELIFRLEYIHLGNLRAFIIDEVDNLLDEPFVSEIQTIVEAFPPMMRSRGLNTTTLSTSQSASMERIPPRPDVIAGDDVMPSVGKSFICLASATGNDPKVLDFANRYCLANWQKVVVGSGSYLPKAITHGLISSPRMRSLEMLKKFLKAKPLIGSALIFVNEPRRVEIIAEKLLEMGIVAAPLSGDSTKDDRKEILARIRDGRLNLVVTTELAARGLDIPNLTHVINFELPTDAPHYVHRAGRCGRARRQGLVMNFANPDTKFVIRRFGKKLGFKVLDCEIREGQVFLKK